MCHLSRRVASLLPGSTLAASRDLVTNSIVGTLAVRLTGRAVHHGAFGNAVRLRALVWAVGLYAVPGATLGVVWARCGVGTVWCGHGGAASTGCICTYPRSTCSCGTCPHKTPVRAAGLPQVLRQQQQLGAAHPAGGAQAAAPVHPGNPQGLGAQGGRMCESVCVRACMCV